MIKYSTPKTKVRKIKSTDPNFNITTDWIIYPRAAIHISQRCPDTYKHLIEECVNHGWIKPVAHVTEKEYLWMNLANDN